MSHCTIAALLCSFERLAFQPGAAHLHKVREFWYKYAGSLPSTGPNAVYGTIEMAGTRNVALVFGASGISGWAVTKNLLSYPSFSTFDRVIALTNRPRSLAEFSLPQDPRLELYSGIDLCGNLDQVLERMKETIPNLNEITHMYYCGMLIVKEKPFGRFEKLIGGLNDSICECHIVYRKCHWYQGSQHRNDFQCCSRHGSVVLRSHICGSPDWHQRRPSPCSGD